MNFIALNKEIPCDLICKKVQDLVNTYVKENGSVQNCVLVLDIKTISDSQITTGPLLIVDKINVVD